MSEWSGLAEEARKRTREAGPRCAVEVFLSHLDAEDQRLVVEALNDPNLTTVGIHRVISGRMKITPSVWSIGNHRNKKCRCSR